MMSRKIFARAEWSKTPSLETELRKKIQCGIVPTSATHFGKNLYPGSETKDDRTKPVF